MGSQTANLAIPYPVGTDLLADGDNAIQALAERVDALLMASNATIPWVTLVPAVGTNNGAPMRNLGYRKVGGYVEFRGRLIAAGGMAAGTNWFTLPVGYRPIATVSLLVMALGGTNGYARVDVQAVGQCLIQDNIAAGGGFTIDLMRFSLD